MKIEVNNLKSVGGPPANEPRPRTQPNPQQTGDSQGKVQLSSLSSSLSKAEAAIANTPVVDRARVDEIREAISQGRFQVDPNRIADGLIQSVRDMLDARG